MEGVLEMELMEEEMVSNAVERSDNPGTTLLPLDRCVWPQITQ